MEVIYKILLTVLHLIYSCLDMAVLLWCFVRRKYHELFSKSDLEYDLHQIKRCVKHIRNIPTHLAFILVNEDSVSFEDLANLLLWCSAAGISFVSFYDHDGLLKRCKSEFMAVVSTKKGADKVIWGQSSCTASSNGHHNCFSNGKGPSHELLNGTNGRANGTNGLHSIRVNLLNRNDTRGTMVKAAVLLSHGDGLKGESSAEKIHRTSKALSTLQEMEHGPGFVLFPDPEMVVWCGTLPCSAGFHPFNLRISEFFQLRSHQDVSQNDFVSLLRRYSKCEQRLGK